MKNLSAVTILLVSTAPLMAQPAAPVSSAVPSSAEGNLERLLAARPVLAQPLTLDQAVAIALRESPVVRGAVAEVEAAAGQLNAARAERKPWLSTNTFLSGGSLSNIVQSPTAVQPSMIMNLPRGGYVDQNLMLMVPLSTGGRLNAMVRQAAARRDAVQAEASAQRQEVALLTRLAYREVLACRALVDVQQSRLRENEEQLRIDRVRAEEGKIPPFYVQRDEAEVAATQQEITNAARDVELALAQLQTVMGISPASRLEITETLSYQPSVELLQRLTGVALATAAPTPTSVVTLPPDLPLLLRLAERQRPELQAATQRIQAAQADVAATRSAYRPQVNAFAMGDILKLRGADATSGATLGLAASVPIFNGGQRNARVQTAEAQRRQQEAEQTRLALQISQEVTNALLNLRAAEQNIGTAQAALKAAQEDDRVARLRYEAGKSVLVEALDALATRVRAESNVVQALYSYNVAHDQLRRAVGEPTMREPVPASAPATALSPQ